MLCRQSWPSYSWGWWDCHLSSSWEFWCKVQEPNYSWTWGKRKIQQSASSSTIKQNVCYPACQKHETLTCLQKCQRDPLSGRKDISSEAQTSTCWSHLSCRSLQHLQSVVSVWTKPHTHRQTLTSLEPHAASRASTWGNTAFPMDADPQLAAYTSSWIMRAVHSIINNHFIISLRTLIAIDKKCS